MKLNIYVDGSYTKARPDEVSGGYVIVDRNEKPICGRRVYSKRVSFTNMNNVGGELLATISALSQGVILLAQSQPGVPEDSIAGEIEIFHDYKGIESFIQGNPRWRASKPGSVLYVNTFTAIKKKFPMVHFSFKKVKAHSGIKWNEIADAIANDYEPSELKGMLLEQHTI